jgi:hypothetical protein
MGEVENTQTHRSCPSCGAEAKPEITNCEGCWRPLPFGLDPAIVPAVKTPVPTSVGNPDSKRPPRSEALSAQIAQAQTIPVAEAGEPVVATKKRSGKKILLIAVILVCIVGAGFAIEAVRHPSTSQSQSYKDGYKWGENHLNNFGPNDPDNESVAQNCSLAWGIDNGVPGRGIPKSDNENQWKQGCTAGVTAALK